MAWSIGGGDARTGSDVDLLVDLDPLGFDRTVLAATPLTRATAVGELPSTTSFTLTPKSS